jgi:hypothetical protein
MISASIKSHPSNGASIALSSVLHHLCPRPKSKKVKNESLAPSHTFSSRFQSAIQLTHHGPVNPHSPNTNTVGLRIRGLHTRSSRLTQKGTPTSQRKTQTSKGRSARSWPSVASFYAVGVFSWISCLCSKNFRDAAAAHSVSSEIMAHMLEVEREKVWVGWRGMRMGMKKIGCGGSYLER